MTVEQDLENLQKLVPTHPEWKESFYRLAKFILAVKACRDTGRYEDDPLWRPVDEALGLPRWGAEYVNCS